MLNAYPALLLNADYRPLSIYPLSLLSVERSIRAMFKGSVDVLETYDKVIRSPSTEIRLPAVVALKRYRKTPTKPNFTRFNVFLRDGFHCMYCGEPFQASSLTFDHVIARSKGGKTEWTNITSACSECNTSKDDADMTPIVAPFEPTIGDLMKMARRFPPNYLHESWIDYCYWDSPLEA